MTENQALPENIDEFLEKNKDGAQALAHQIHNLFGNKWFKLQELVKNCKGLTPEEVQAKLWTLSLFKYCVKRNSLTGVRYKILVKIDETRKELLYEIERLKKEIVVLEDELKKLDE